MVVMSMTDCVNSTVFLYFVFFLFGGWGVFFHFYWGRAVDQNHERQYLTLSSLSSWITFVSLKRSGLFSPYQTIFE